MTACHALYNEILFLRSTSLLGSTSNDVGELLDKLRGAIDTSKIFSVRDVSEGNPSF